MNIHCFLFVYNGNKEATPYTVKCLRWAAAKLRSYDSVKITVADDARHPAFTDKKEQEGLKAIGVDEYVQTSFPRRGNIRGGECVIGMLKLYNSTSCKTDWVIQCDNDMLLKTFEYLRVEGADLTGHRRDDIPTHANWIYNIVYGPGLSIRRRFVPAMLEIAQAYPFVTEDKDGVASDVFQCACAVKAGALVSAHTPEYGCYHVTPEYRYFAAYLDAFKDRPDVLREAYMISIECHPGRKSHLLPGMHGLLSWLLGTDAATVSLDTVVALGASCRMKWNAWTLVKEWWARWKHRRYVKSRTRRALVA